MFLDKSLLPLQGILDGELGALSVICLLLWFFDVGRNAKKIISGWKKNWKNEHANDLRVCGYFSASRRSILMQFLTICSPVFFFKQVKKTFWKFDATKYWLSAQKLAASFTIQFDSFIQTLMLAPYCIRSGQKDIEELPMRKVYLKLGTMLVQLCLF